MYFGIENEKETYFFRGIDLIFQFSRNAPDNACENITFRKLCLRLVIKTRFVVLLAKMIVPFQFLQQLITHWVVTNCVK